ncbi:MAG: hypothetical protein KDH16_19815 [Rhodocyclaceae bacterium]|nr:hypothetical protein [Rhodocyclaceae bacterium]
MSYTQAQLDAIRESYARGVLEAVLPDGSKVRYRSLAEMAQIISEISASITTPTSTNVIYPTHKRGY